jgi:RND family efflux transporter MFP subunit
VGGLKPAPPSGFAPSGGLKSAPPATLLGGLTIAVLILTAACSPPHTPAPSETASVPVSTGVVDSGSWPSFTEAGGTLTARLTATVSSRILAPVVAVNVRAGDRVRRGQVVVELDAAEYQAQATRSTSSLEAARLAADAAAAEVNGAQAALELATLTHDRIRTLHEQQSATTQELDQAVAGLSGAQSRLAAARAAAEGATAAFAAARSAAKAGEIVATYGALTAPFDGVVVERYVDPGTMAAPGAPLVVIEDPGALRLEVTVDATRAAGVVVGASADVRLDVDGIDSAWVEGRIAEVARVDPGSQSFTVKIDVPAKPEWRSGLFGRARFRGASRQTTAAPAAAVLTRGQLALVFVVSPENVARLRAVRTGDRLGDRMEILAGLSAGEVVIVDPPATLADGDRVTTTAWPAGTDSQSGAGR